MTRDSTTIAGRSPSRESRLSARFRYRRMTPKEFRDELQEIDLPPHAFARIFGVRPETITKWMKGDQDIPPWPFVALWLMREIPEGIAIARTAAANHIEFDNENPWRGEFPYLKIPDDSDQGEDY